MTRLCGFCLFLVGTLWTTGRLQAEESTGITFSRLLDESWEFELREDPSLATQSGEHRYNDLLPQVSLADAARRQQVCQGFLDRLAEIDHDRRSPSEQVNYTIFASGVSLGGVWGTRKFFLRSPDGPPQDDQCRKARHDEHGRTGFLGIQQRCREVGKKKPNKDTWKQYCRQQELVFAKVPRKRQCHERQDSAEHKEHGQRCTDPATRLVLVE